LAKKNEVPKEKPSSMPAKKRGEGIGITYLRVQGGKKSGDGLQRLTLPAREEEEKLS